MCYSVMVETDLKKLEHDFRADVDVDGFLRILRDRAKGKKNLKVARGMEPYFDQPRNAIEEECKDLIDAFTAQEIQKFEQKAFDKRRIIAECEAKLAKKWTKTNQTKLETAKRVLDKALYDIERLNGPIIPTDSCIFQYYYAPLLVETVHGRKIKFFRYQVRPRWADREPARQINMFNARLDMIEERRTWRPLFMQQHAALVFKGFYEWVDHPDTGKSAIIQFLPEDGELMWAPALFEHYHSLDEQIDSFAILTRDPPPEVEAMGHDRCPIFPAWDEMETWLRPEQIDKAGMLKAVGNLKEITYRFEWAA